MPKSVRCRSVIHGGSGIAPEILRSFVNDAFAKVKIPSDLRKAFITAVGKAYVNNHNEANLARVMASAKNAVEEDVYSKILMMNEGIGWLERHLKSHKNIAAQQKLLGRYKL
ncbi:class II fructose-bisphosphate aldolase [Escherichia coli]